MHVASHLDGRAPSFLALPRPSDPVVNLIVHQGRNCLMAEGEDSDFSLVSLGNG